MTRTLATLLAVLCGSTAIGCGGGGGGAKAHTTTSISGTAATGAPLAGATVTLIDKNGAVAGLTTTDSQGAYAFASVDVTVHPPPYVLTVFGDTGGTRELLVSVKADASPGIANITPITNAIAASMSSTGDPLGFVTSTATESANITPENVTSADTAYQAALASVVSSVGATGSFLSAAYTAVQDRLLDNVTVQVFPNGQVTISTSGGTQANDLDPSTTAPAAAQVVTLDPGQLPSASAASSLPAPATVVAAADLEPLRQAFQGCFAVPSASRGTFASPNASCAALAASTYLHDGKTGATEFNGPFLANPLMDGATFLTPAIARYLASDKIVVELVYRRADGIVGMLETVATNVSSSWVLTGNGREFLTWIYGAVSRREWLGNAAANRYETGFTLYMPYYPNVTQVVITGPGLPGYVDVSNQGTGISLKPKAGCDFLAIVRPSDNTTPYCSDYYRVRSRTFAGADFVSSSAPYQYRSPYLTDDEITAIAPGTLYRYVITKSDTTTVTYWNRLRSRPYTVAELAQVQWLDFSPETRAQIAAGFPTAAPAKVGMSWIRPETVAPAYAIQIFHSQGNDRTDLSFGATSGTVACTGNSLCALDCTGNYLVNSLNAPGVTMYQLSSRNRFGTIKYVQLMQ
jgi:hypothetical protein